MRRWRYVEPGEDGVTPVVVEKTEAEILAEYYDWWAGQMRERGKVDEATHQACIEDWVVVYWAEEVL